MANQEMAELWNGPATSSWVQRPDRYDGMLHELGLLALDAADLRPGDHVLDVGCGSGQLTRQAAERVGEDGSVIGADLSQPLVRLATARSADVPQVRHIVADVQLDRLEGGPFDVILSRFGVMFFDDPVVAFANIGDATASRGRLAAVAWQAASRNEWVTTAVDALAPVVGPPPAAPPGTPGPFAFADEDCIRQILADSGWVDVAIDGVAMPVRVAATVEEATDFYAKAACGRALLAEVDAATRAAGHEALREMAAARIGPDGLTLGAAVWLVTAHRP